LTWRIFSSLFDNLYVSRFLGFSVSCGGKLNEFLEIFLDVVVWGGWG
jgi:hypothetical protein